MSLGKQYHSINGCTPRKAEANNSSIDLNCSLCILERKNSKIFKSPKALYHHVLLIHKDWNDSKITKKQFIKILDNLSKALDLQVILQ